MLIQRFKFISFGLLLQATVCGCTPGTNSILNQVDVAVPPTDLTAINSDQEYNVGCLISILPIDQPCRNNYIAMRMFQIDQIYSGYVGLLYRGDAFGTLGGDIAQIGLSGVGAVIPVSQTTKVLTAASTAVGLANAAVNKDLLFAQTLQAIEQQMNTQRASVKLTLLARMACPAAQYPAGLVLADLQAYADAGTVNSALAGMAKATANAQPAASGTSGTATPATINSNSDASAAAGSAITYPTITTQNKGTLKISYTPPKNSPPKCPLPKPGA